MSPNPVMLCPFCGFKETNDYRMLLHVEIYHAEDGESPFTVHDAPASPESPAREATIQPRNSDFPSLSSEPEYLDCPHKCGERVLATEIQYHTDFHIAEDIAMEESSAANELESDDASTPSKERHPVREQNSHRRRRPEPTLKQLFFGSPEREKKKKELKTTNSAGIKRLGRAELGPYAHEKRMPGWLQRLLEEGAKVTVTTKIGADGTLVQTRTVANETEDLVPTLAQLSCLDTDVARAFYCSPHVLHIAKMRMEGGFCGYRNIQMLVSYIRGAKAPGHEHFAPRVPTIMKLQEMIEDAWDKGYNSTARIETGGIMLTRKYIGTPEAQALFMSLDIRCEAVAYTSTAQSEAHITLLQAIFEYFDDGSDMSHQVVVTDKPPIYLQHRGHSMTIVGVEVKHDGAANLVVYDPMFNPSTPLKKLITVMPLSHRHPAQLLKAHRRGERYLSKYKDFEILKISGPPLDAVEPSEHDTD